MSYIHVCVYVWIYVSADVYCLYTYVVSAPWFENYLGVGYMGFLQSSCRLCLDPGLSEPAAKFSTTKNAGFLGSPRKRCVLSVKGTLLIWGGHVKGLHLHFPELAWNLKRTDSSLSRTPFSGSMFVWQSGILKPGSLRILPSIFQRRLPKAAWALQEGLPGSKESLNRLQGVPMGLSSFGLPRL